MKALLACKASSKTHTLLDIREPNHKTQFLADQAPLALLFTDLLISFYSLIRSGGSLQSNLYAADE